MKLNLAPTELIDQLRAWFHPKDRAVVIPATLSAVAVASGATLAMAFIQEQVLTASASSITLGSIPQNFRMLFLVGQLRTDRVAESDSANLRFNGDAGSNYDVLRSQINSGGNSTTPNRATSSIIAAQVEAASSRASNFTSFSVEIFGYSLTDRDKWIACDNSGAFGDVSADTDISIVTARGRWRSTVAIKAITVIPNTGPNFVSGSRVALYGIL